jgi:RNA polymerase sigma-70 factor (ECF subfamily)
VIFRLTRAAVTAPNEGVEAMPDRTRPQPLALLARARRSEPAAYRELFQTHVAAVHRIIRRLTGAPAEVEDLVQTTFVEAFRALPTFRGDALFSTWLTRIAVRVSLRAGRRRAPRALSLDDVGEPAADLPGPERITAARETLAVLEALLAELRPKRRAAFALHVLEGHSMEEVAAILNTSTAAVKVRVHDARRHIEKRLARNPDLLASLRRRGGTP